MRLISSLVDSDELIDNYLDQSDWRVKENANMTYSLQGLNNHVVSIISANYWMNKIYNKEIRKAHIFQSDIHIHDYRLYHLIKNRLGFERFLMEGLGEFRER